MAISSLFQFFIIIFSAIIHEYAHAWAAFKQGDLTAKYEGRLTLNPLAHIDWFGTVFLPLMILYISGGGAFFGYAKPVPINPYNFKDQRRGMIWVSLAGVAANLAIALIAGLGLRFFPQIFLSDLFNIQAAGSQVFNAWVVIVIINIWLALFNLLPFPPLDGSKLLMALTNVGRSTSGRVLSFFASPFGFIIAIFIAMTFLPTLSQVIFTLIVGG